MKIRRALLDDADGVSKLFDYYRIFYKKESDLIAAKEFITKRLQQNDSIIYVCQIDDNELAGFVQLYPLFSSTRMSKLWLLNDLFVAAEHRGKGISKLLIDQAKELVKSSGACGMFLETEKSNIIGNQLYPRAGFSLNDASNYYEWSITE